MLCAVQRTVGLLIITACTGVSSLPRRDLGVEQVSRVAETADAAGFASMFSPSLVLGGLWFPDAECQRRFGGAGPVDKAQHVALGRCLASLHLERDNRKSFFPDIGMFVYEPGIEIEIAFTGNRTNPTIRWIGFTARWDESDSLPTVTPALLQAHQSSSEALGANDIAELDRELAAHKLTLLIEWFKVCIDADGKLTSVTSRGGSTLGSREVFGRQIKSWELRPVELGGRPTPVCSVVKFSHPAGKASADLWLPMPATHTRLPVILIATLGDPIEGDKYASPYVLVDFMRRAGIDDVIATAAFCIDEQGKVNSVLVTRTTGFPQADLAFARTVARRRYRPYVFGGTARAVCSQDVHSVHLKRR
jgi:hypothetical protein